MPMIATRFRPIIVLVALIWSVEVVNFFLGHRLASWGILPRSFGGLISQLALNFTRLSELEKDVPLAHE